MRALSLHAVDESAGWHEIHAQMRSMVVIKLCEFKKRCMLLLRWTYIGIQERRPKERIRCGFRDHMII